MNDEQLARLREAVFAEATMRDSYHHGEQHWKAVAWAGLELVRRTPGAQPLVVLCFALFHDAMRENEYTDPEHGLRGAELARRLHGQTNLLPAAHEELLYVACRDHTDVDRTDNPTIGACWDADRVNLWRVGITPDSWYLSTGRAAEVLPESREYHGRAYDWDELSAATSSWRGAHKIGAWSAGLSRRCTMRATPRTHASSRRATTSSSSRTTCR